MNSKKLIEDLVSGKLFENPTILLLCIHDEGYWDIVHKGTSLTEIISRDYPVGQVLYSPSTLQKIKEVTGVADLEKVRFIITDASDIDDQYRYEDVNDLLTFLSGNENDITIQADVVGLKKTEDYLI